MEFHKVIEQGLRDLECLLVPKHRQNLIVTATNCDPSLNSERRKKDNWEKCDNEDDSDEDDSDDDLDTTRDESDIDLIPEEREDDDSETSQSGVQINNSSDKRIAVSNPHVSEEDSSSDTSSDDDRATKKGKKSRKSEEREEDNSNKPGIDSWIRNFEVDDSGIKKKMKKCVIRKQKEDEYTLDDGYLSIELELCEQRTSKPNEEVRMLSSTNEVLAKSALVPGFEKLDAVPSHEVSRRKLKLQRKMERERTKGEKWFNMPATEITDEIKHDLEVLQMRSVLDPKHFYKKNDLKVLPKYFQVGQVVESPADFYNSRVPKKERKRTMVDELLADADFQNYNKKRYKEIIEERRKTTFKAFRHAKRLKRKGRSKK